MTVYSRPPRVNWTRIWMGSLMAGLAGGVLFLDQFLAGWYPFLLLMTLVLGGLSCREMLRLLRRFQKPLAWFCTPAVLLLLLSNWAAHIPLSLEIERDPWRWVLGTFTVLTLVAFVIEVLTFREGDGAVLRLALGLLMLVYLGLLPCFLMQLRWQPGQSGADDFRGAAALALAIFVPKCGDIGAYFVGRYLGRRPMAPRLSPKKTWEGFAGGVAASALAAVVLNWLVPLLNGLAAALAFGVTVNLVGVLGDLAESLIKRDGHQKDASQVVPGFGGVLDVIDSVIFAAPLAYWWLRCSPARL
jgi:phosphatidate cytidylyltransferase